MGTLWWGFTDRATSCFHLPHQAHQTDLQALDIYMLIPLKDRLVASSSDCGYFNKLELKMVPNSTDWVAITNQLHEENMKRGGTQFSCPPALRVPVLEGLGWPPERLPGEWREVIAWASRNDMLALIPPQYQTP